MTCQHCQTWILDDDHRCRRCGRRVRSTPSRVSPETFPIAATATAPAYDFDEIADATVAPEAVPSHLQPGQQVLFPSTPAEPRVIPFASLTSPAEREAIRARAADAPRPAPVRHAKVELRHAKPKRKHSSGQHRLDFLGAQQVLSPPQEHIICDAPVAPAALRTQAALIDALMIALGCSFGAVSYWLAGGRFSFDRHVLPFFAAALLTLPVFYKLLWAFAGRDSAGMQAVRLRLVDFDGNPPAKRRRYLRFFASFISLLAAGAGLLWTLVDEDALTWHDHMSSTFPTLSAED